MSESNNLKTVPFAVFCGLGVGKGEHHATALNTDGGRLYDRPLPNDEAALQEVFTMLAEFGRVLVVVDQPASIGALPVAVARAVCVEVAYLPGPAMRRIADLDPGQTKTDARDAYVIADAARTMPHTLRRMGLFHERCFWPDAPGLVRRERTRCVMTSEAMNSEGQLAASEDEGQRRSAEQAAAAAMVAAARELGLALTGPDGLLKLFTKNVLETALDEGMTEHLGHKRHRAEPDREDTNVRNGRRVKTVLSDAVGEAEINVPRDRDGTFSPQIVKKRQRRLGDVCDPRRGVWVLQGA